MDNLEQHLFLRALKFGVTKPQGFTQSDILEAIKAQDWEREIIIKYLISAGENESESAITRGRIKPTPFLLTKRGSIDSNTNNHYIVNYEAFFNYIDYVELKEAREVARQARVYSFIAIAVSVVALVASAFIPFYISWKVTQTVELTEDQFIELVGELRSIPFKHNF